jgi:protein-S-isoprenylcysteine O-methyltransferase Ste14
VQPRLYTSAPNVPAQVPDTLLEWMLAGAGGATLIVFAVALQNFFVQPPTLTRAQRLFQDVSVVVGLTHGLALLILDSAGEVWSAIGIAMYAVALALFLAAIEAARRVPLTRTFVYSPRCDTILTQGPYRFIRHPIYLSYSLAWLAAPIAMHSIVLGITAVFMIPCYVISARDEERILATGPKAAEYATLRARTWRMIPFIY